MGLHASIINVYKGTKNHVKRLSKQVKKCILDCIFCAFCASLHAQMSFEFSRQNCRPVQGTFNKNIQTQILFLDTDTFSKSIQVQILVKYSQKNIQILYFVFRYKYLNRSAKLIKLFSRKYLDTDTFEILSEKVSRYCILYLDTDT